MTICQQYSSDFHIYFFVIHPHSKLIIIIFVFFANEKTDDQGG